MGPANFAAQRQRMAKTGIGLAGAEGVWWLPAVEPFVLPAQLKAELVAIGRAMFLLFDTVGQLYGRLDDLTTLLEANVPAQICRRVSKGQVELLRPDFQLHPGADGAGTQLVATELEICPSAHGFAHAMQVGYNQPADLVESFARYLGGRTLLMAGTIQWSEFLFEQLAFCRAPAEVGARGRVLYEQPVAAIARSVQRGKRRQPPMFGIPQKTAGWNDDVSGRIRLHKLEPYLWPYSNEWPDDVGDAVVFRFGYVDCFDFENLQRFYQWQAGGATFLNPPTFYLDSKVLMAALAMPQLRDEICAAHPDALTVLARCIPETILLQPHRLPMLLTSKDDWLIKYAGFDGGNNAWGGRSLQLGRGHTAGQWQQILQQALDLPWPVVAQRLVPSAKVDIAYVDADDGLQWLHRGATRLRSFILRQPDDSYPQVCGSHLTVSGGTMQVSEGVDAVQAPVIFSG